MKVLSKITLLTVVLCVLSGLTACSMDAGSSGGNGYSHLFNMIPESTGPNPVYQPNPEYGKDGNYWAPEYLLYGCPDFSFLDFDKRFEVTENEITAYSKSSYGIPEEILYKMYNDGYVFARDWYTSRFVRPAAMRYIYTYREISDTKGYLYCVPVKAIAWGERYNGEEYEFKEYEAEVDHKVLIYEYEYKGMPYGYYPDYEYKKVIQDDLKTATLFNIEDDLFYGNGNVYFSLNKIEFRDNNYDTIFTTEDCHLEEEYYGLSCKNFVITDEKDSKEFDLHVIGKRSIEKDFGYDTHNEDVLILLKLKIKYSDIQEYSDNDKSGPYCDITVVSVEDDKNVEVFSSKNENAQNIINYEYERYGELITETVNYVKEALVGKNLVLDKTYNW